MKAIEKFLSELSTELDILSLVDIEEIDHNDAYYSIEEMIRENGGFNVDIIYYYNSIEYLQKNDPSLRESLEIACDMGLDANNLNSEILASLLASRKVEEEFFELKEEIEEFFEGLEEE